jgi:CheY-like chemotaxis protein
VPGEVALALASLVREDLPVLGALATVSDEAIADIKSLFAGRCVLVLEDNPMSRAVVERQFKTLGVEAELAENGRLGLEALERREFALILSDCAMPEIDGYLFTQILRRRELGSGTHIPVIAMTANAADDDAKKCLAAGMDDYLAKPVRLSVLARVLTHWGGGSVPVRNGGSNGHSSDAIDLGLLAEILGDQSAGAMDEALELFGEFFPGFLDDARQANSAGDVEAMMDAAHTAKGAARNAGALALGLALGHAEDHAKIGDIAAYGRDLATAEVEWQRVQAFIEGRRA